MPSPLDLTTAQTAADVLRVPVADLQLPRLITAVSRAIASHVGYPLQHRAGVVETVPGSGGYYLFLKSGAVRQVTSVKVDGVELAPGEWRLESPLMGRILGVRPFPFTGTTSGGVSVTPMRVLDMGRVEVTFDAGWWTPGQKVEDDSVTVDLPEDVQQAALEVVSAWYRRGGQDMDVASRSLGGASLSYAAPRSIPVTARELLAPYRKPARWG